MAYADTADYAIDQGYATWAAYHTAHPTYPVEDTLTQELTDMSSIINFEIGSFADITDTRFTPWLQQLTLQMVKRKHDVEVMRKTENRQLFMPHDFLYADERAKCKEIGKILKYNKRIHVVF